MRYIRYAWLILLAIVLVSVSIANRELVTVSLMPDALEGLLGFNLSVTLPLFLIILGGIIAGLVIGFIWEWTREYRQRREAALRAREMRKLEREVGRLKDQKNEGKDEVLAILDDTV